MVQSSIPKTLICAPALMAVAVVSARADPPFQPQFDIEGYADFRLYDAGHGSSWVDGSDGKFRYGGGGLGVRAGPGAVEGVGQITPDVSVFVDMGIDPDLQDPVGIIEAYATYHAFPNRSWHWTLKGGVFFPPVSLENDGAGWTSLWTLTPSAINSWIGQEVRSVGGESRIDWRGAAGTVSLTSALFVDNELAGSELASAGWTLGDVTTALPTRLTLYNPLGTVENPYEEIDGHVGWYTGLTGRLFDYGAVSVLRYQNEADPGKRSSTGEFAWRTDYWSVGLDSSIGPVTLLAQAMIGNTIVNPTSELHNRTNFQAAYLLAGWNHGDWRVAIREDFFGTQQIVSFPITAVSENGNAGTVAVTWRAKSWLKLIGEVVLLDYVRSINDPRRNEAQSQLALRVTF